MNLSTETTFVKNQSAKRGVLARKLLQVAKRQTRSAVPAPSTISTVLGPYPNGAKWRLIVKDGTGRKSFVYGTEQEALAVRATILGALDDRASMTVGDAVEEFLTFKLKQGCVARSVRTVRDKLVPLLPVSKSLISITPQCAEGIYSAYTEKCAVATHHGSLRYTKAFFRYCVKQKYIAVNPFTDVQPIGRANAGKPQLRQDEARTLSNYLINEATSGELPALALLVQVILGLRSGEVLKLRKRDLDCHATIVVVDGTKNKNAKRSLELDAPVIRDLLLHRCASLAPDAFIFAQDGAERPLGTPGLWKALARYCKRAKVPLVCPHSLRGLHSSLAVKAGATSSFVAQALGHGSDAVTRKHYIAPSALASARSARVAGALLGESDLDSLIGALRNLPSEQFDRVCAAVGVRR